MGFNQFETFILKSVDRISGRLKCGETSGRELDYWRERIVLAIYAVFISIGLIVCIPSVYLAVQTEKWWIAFVDISSYIACLYCFFSKRLSFKIRAFFLLLIIYGIGVTLMLTTSPNFALIWLFCFSVVTSLLFSFTVACRALMINFFTLLITGILLHYKMVEFGHSGPLEELGWLIIFLNFLLLNSVTTIGIVILVERLKRAIDNERKGRKSLLQKHLLLKNETNQRKEAEQEQKILHNKLQQDRKMKAIGLMAGGVAHDLNNILSGLISYPELILMQLPKDSNLRNSVEAIRGAGIRAAEVVDNLLTIARDAATVKEVNNVNGLVEEFFKSPEFLKIDEDHKRIQLVSRLDPNLENCICSPVHIQKCLLNLVLNAFEAIDGVGKVIVSSYNEYVSQQAAKHLNVEEGKFIVISVADTGRGINKESLEHIFEPFYTKKIMGKSGSGLGLAVVWNSVQDHKGGIFVDSNSSGTTFQLYFPSTSREVVSPKELGDIEQYHGNRETILVVDDELQQRNVATRLLELLNYKSFSVSSGEMAVDYLDNHSVDLVLLDMIMEPGMNGRQTYEKIIERSPGQKAIIASGYSVNNEVIKAQKLGAIVFIKKPYTLVQLGKAVQDGLLLQHEF